MSNFKLPESSQRADFVKNNFDAISKKYDLFNDINSFYMHRMWKNDIVKLINKHSYSHFSCLDLCCGTGDISLKILKKTKVEKLYAIDFSENMLSIAKEKLSSFKNCELQIGDATNLKNFKHKSFDVVTMGFGLRNVDSIEATLLEVHRVLKPGGIFINLDVGKVFNPLIKPFAYLYFFKIVPLIGYMIWGGKNEMFDYLPVSSIEYPDQRKLKDMLFEKGFVNVKYSEYVFGNAVLHHAYKPD